MATDDIYVTTTGGTWIDGTVTSGYATHVNDTAYLDTTYNEGYSYVMPELEDDGFEPIQGNPKGAKYLVSYMFKEPKDPVVFLKNKKDMESLVKELLKDEKVDHKSIIIHKISSQFKPKMKIKKKTVEVEELEIKKMKK